MCNVYDVLIKNAPLLTNTYAYFKVLSLILTNQCFIINIKLNMINIPVNTANKDWKWKGEYKYIF